MTSAEIKRMLQPMKDFAPAILRCAEIVEAAEQAEGLLKEQDGAVKAAMKELAALAKQTEEAQAELGACCASVDQAKKDTAAEKSAIADTLTATKEKLKAAQEALDATQKEHANTLAAHKQELDGLDIVLEAKKKELADFRRAIPKTY
jgi:ABC-type transporter Mla subunit MlaD